ncbi:MULTISPECIES: hypothetical protein [Haloferax]|uniref:Uncharacterized protein n=1 Tax=Haloferax marinum TaxID=2666143 RepID=A0A6A8GAC4_9EURY|nr:MULTISPECIES: hypothetical protein [Haloferax]KAB1191139.1 hypothetical protein Hfx1150_15770 [Haloferax sp. CBA1150]MRW98024.1 hypothetical protein [Haloferax marinum]
MAGDKVRRRLAVASLLFLVVVGAGIGVWNYQDVRACHDMYDDDPSVIVECEDSFTDVVRGVSVLSVTVGCVGLILTVRRGKRL